MLKGVMHVNLHLREIKNFYEIDFFHFYERTKRKLIISCPLDGRQFRFRVILKVSINLDNI
jgi:hypothetical protein